VPARTDRQGIGWSIPLMNLNIYYFVLELSMQGCQPNWQLVSGCSPQFQGTPPSASADCRNDAVLTHFPFEFSVRWMNAATWSCSAFAEASCA
jgi:hypothetical protein